MSKTTATQNLAAVVHESEAAAAEAARAQAAAQVAQSRAEAARTRAEAEQRRAHEAYLATLEAEYSAKRDAALTAQGEARQALEAAVRTGGDIFGSYRAWVMASLAAWGIESAIAQQRHFLGRPSRSVDAPTFSFGHDIGAIIDQASLEAQDDVLEAIREARAAYLAGREAS